MCDIISNMGFQLGHNQRLQQNYMELHESIETRKTNIWYRGMWWESN